MTICTKWPRLLVVGEPVTEAQAAEIIARTTGWDWIHTNDPAWRSVIATALAEAGMPMEPARTTSVEDHATHWRAVDAWKKAHGVLNLSYLGNSRIASSWIFGPHGWIDWDGTVGSGGFNIGKWPSDEEVTSDWRAIAEAFPFLTLMAQCVEEEGDGRLASQWTVSGGQVVHDPEPTEFIRPVPAFGDGAQPFEFRERGCSVEQLRYALSLLKVEAQR